jgi:chromosome segregation protein
VALQAVLSATLDALVVDNQANGIDLLSMLAAGGHGRINLVLQETHDHGMQYLEGFKPLRELVQPSEGSEALADALLRETYLLDSLDALPSPLPPNACFVTRDGAVAHGNGRLSLWSAEEGDSNPMARQQKLDELNAEQAELQTALDALNREIQTSTGQQESLQVRLTSAASALQEARRVLAVKEGEAQVIQGEASGARKRQETVGFELQALIEQTSEGSGRREELASKIEEKRRELTEVRGTIQSRTESLRIVEDSRAKQLNEFSEQRVLLSEARQRLQQLDNQLQSQKSRIQELEHLIENRSKGADTYQQKIQSLQDSSKAIEEEIPALLEQLKKEQDRLQELRNHRQTGTEELRTMEGELRGRRHHADELRARRNLLQIEQTEKSTRRQAAFERLASDYNVSLEDIMGAPEPEWEEGVRPDKDKLETRIAELKTKLESMGPVNLVAIEEHQELEERFAFLTQQQQDLINAKTQLIEMIKKINATTTELFKTTFDQVNEHFAVTFTRLFGGGSAKLVLLDEEDILESGIEIIARPPGKKLQTISLLSGGERTMTAVALLFALFKVKPSPFCVLDEIDAALDESNIGRFVEMVQDYLSMSQFVVISHSRKTIAAADVLYGVTMQTRGISKIVSVKMNDGKKEPELIDAPAVATT